ncbi:MAG TPA: septum formation family protein [Acidimicrobiales bacterium]|jgi:hypothetical protein|nr:septum formation family protein [Acidimicrobiales bacterium]
MPGRAFACALLVAGGLSLGLAACSDSAGVTGGEAPTSAGGAASPAPTTTSLAPVGEPINRFTLNVGDCFNRYDSIEVTTRVPCAGPHDREVYFKTTYPAPFGEPFPGAEAMERWAVKACYGEFAKYVGQIYELSELGLGAIAPTKENFEDDRARYRGITCFLVRNDRQQLVGTMRDSRK